MNSRSVHVKTENDCVYFRSGANIMVFCLTLNSYVHHRMAGEDVLEVLRLEKAQFLVIFHFLVVAIRSTQNVSSLIITHRNKVPT